VGVEVRGLFDEVLLGQVLVALEVVVEGLDRTGDHGRLLSQDVAGGHGIPGLLV